MKGLVILVVLGMMAQAGLASAAIDLNPLEGAYGPGEYVNLGGIFSNNYTESKGVRIEQVLLHEGIDTMPGFSDESLGPGRIAVIRGLGFTVQGTMDPGEYTYMITVYEGDNPLETVSASFEIAGTSQEFKEMMLRVCTSPGCSMLKSVFTVEETAYIGVLGHEDAGLTGYVEDDFGFRKELDFQDGVAGFRLDKPSHFRVRVFAEREGYKSYMMETDFFVIEGNFILTEFFPMMKWIYNVIFAIIVIAVLATVALSLFRGRKKRDRLEEWLKWRKWREKDKIGYLLGSGKRP